MDVLCDKSGAAHALDIQNEDDAQDSSSLPIVIGSGAILTFSGIVTALSVLSIVFTLWLYCVWRKNKEKERQYALVMAKSVDSDHEQRSEEIEMIAH